VELHDPVVTENGLVGMVCEVDATTCKVRTILSPDIQVGVLNSRTSDSGIVTGSSKYSDDNLSLMTKIPAQHTMQEGDIIVTSGLGGIFPQKIRIGEIKEIKLDEYDSQPMAIIKPYENIQEVSLVAIITNYLGKGTISKSESSKESSKQESTASKQ
jgi:rod shape-determining protein MreC